jgi:hypothetical protein
MLPNARFRAAIGSLKAQKVARFVPTAKKYGVDETRLRLTFQGKRGTKADAISTYHKLLTTTQEEELLLLIESLTIRSLAPTPTILENLIEKFIDKRPGTRWMERFIKQYKDRVKSLYLSIINSAHIITDNNKYYNN